MCAGLLNALFSLSLRAHPFRTLHPGSGARTNQLRYACRSPRMNAGSPDLREINTLLRVVIVLSLA
jgi:hypothetical protein